MLQGCQENIFKIIENSMLIEKKESISVEEERHSKFIEKMLKEKDKCELIEEILKINPDAVEKTQVDTGNTALHVAAMSDMPHIVNLLIQYNCPLNAKNKQGKTALHCAVLSDAQDALKALTSYPDIEINAVDSENETAFYKALSVKSEKCASILALSRMVDIDIVNKDGETARKLLNSGRINDTVIAIYGALQDIFGIIECGVILEKDKYRLIEDILKLDIEKQKALVNDRGETALHLAARYNLPEITKLLIQYEYPLNAQNLQGMTALHCAALANAPAALAVLFSASEIVLTTDVEGDTALDKAIRAGSLECVKILALKDVLNKDLLKEKKEIVQQIYDTNFPDKVKKAAIFSALVIDNIFSIIRDDNIKENQKCETITEILSKNIPQYCYVDGLGNTALHLAAERNLLLVTDLLIFYSFPLNIKNLLGMTALHCAALTKASETVKALFSQPDIDIDAVDLKNETALHKAFRSKSLECIKTLFLIKEGKTTNIDIPNKEGKTARELLKTLNAEARLAVYKSVLEDKIDDIFSVILCDIIQEKDKCKLIEKILTQSPNKVHQTYSGDTPLHLAAKLNLSYLIPLFIKWHCPLNSKNNQGMTAIHCAALAGKTEALLILSSMSKNNINTLTSGNNTTTEININAQDLEGETALHKAIRAKSIQCVTILASKINVDIKNKEGKTARDLLENDKTLSTELKDELYVALKKLHIKNAPAIMEQKLFPVEHITADGDIKDLTQKFSKLELDSNFESENFTRMKNEKKDSKLELDLHFEPERIQGEKKEKNKKDNKFKSKVIKLTLKDFSSGNVEKLKNFLKNEGNANQLLSDKNKKPLIYYAFIYKQETLFVELVLHGASIAYIIKNYKEIVGKDVDDTFSKFICRVKEKLRPIAFQEMSVFDNAIEKHAIKFHESLIENRLEEFYLEEERKQIKKDNNKVVSTQVALKREFKRSLTTKRARPLVSEIVEEKPTLPIAPQPLRVSSTGLKRSTSLDEIKNKPDFGESLSSARDIHKFSLLTAEESANNMKQYFSASQIPLNNDERKLNLGKEPGVFFIEDKKLLPQIIISNAPQDTIDLLVRDVNLATLSHSRDPEEEISTNYLKPEVYRTTSHSQSAEDEHLVSDFEILHIKNEDEEKKQKKCIQYLGDLCYGLKKEDAEGVRQFNSIHLRKCVRGLLDEFDPNDILDALVQLVPTLSNIKKLICLYIFKEILLCNMEYAYAYKKGFYKKVERFLNENYDKKDEVNGKKLSECFLRLFKIIEKYSNSSIVSVHMQLSKLILFHPSKNKKRIEDEIINVSKKLPIPYSKEKKIKKLQINHKEKNNIFHDKNLEACAIFVADEIRSVIMQFFQACDLKEFRCKVWEFGKENRKISSPHFTKILDILNISSKFFADLVKNQKTQQEQANVLTVLIHAAKACLPMKDYIGADLNAVYAILGTINALPILPSLLMLVDSKTKKLFAQIQEFSKNSNKLAKCYVFPVPYFVSWCRHKVTMIEHTEQGELAESKRVESEAESAKKKRTESEHTESERAESEHVESEHAEIERTLHINHLLTANEMYDSIRKIKKKIRLWSFENKSDLLLQLSLFEVKLISEEKAKAEKEAEEKAQSEEKEKVENVKVENMEIKRENTEETKMENAEKVKVKSDKKEKIKTYKDKDKDKDKGLKNKKLNFTKNKKPVLRSVQQEEKFEFILAGINDPKPILVDFKIQEDEKAKSISDLSWRNKSTFITPTYDNQKKKTLTFSTRNSNTIHQQESADPDKPSATFRSPRPTPEN